MQVAGSIALGPDSNVTLTAAHGQTNAPPLTVFESSQVERAQILGANLPQWTVTSDDPAALAGLSCAANVFVNATCGNVRTTPTCILGCAALTDISGNDSSFDVKPSSGITTISVQLAGQYAVTPICTVSPALSTFGTVVSAAVSGVSFQPWGTTVTLKTSSAVTHIYGSCRGVTG